MALEKYNAAMVLAGVGDSLGFHWEFNKCGVSIHKKVQEDFGGLSKIHIKPSKFRISDDTVMHLATAEALIKCTDIAKNTDETSFNKTMCKVAKYYIECMNDMSDRAPGITCMGSCSRLRANKKKGDSDQWYRLAFMSRGGGCGAAMRSMCIGLLFPQPSELNQLIKFSIETSRMTHHHPTAYLGGLVSALFTAYGIQGKPIVSWGSSLVNDVLPQAKEYIKQAGVDVEDNLAAWEYFETHWKQYLELRKIESGTSEPVFPDVYDVATRDEFYTSISFMGWGGASGHDAPIIAYDALLGCGGSWDELCNRGILHGGDNDSTGTIAACWYGTVYGIDDVNPLHHKHIEYHSRMMTAAKQLHKMANN